MIREEKIIHAAIEFANAVTDGVQDLYFDIVMKTYIDDAKWADRTMIDKVCEWLSKNMRDYGNIWTGGWNSDSYDQDVVDNSLIRDLKDAMGNDK